MTNESVGKKALAERKVKFLERQIASLMAQQRYCKYMRELYFSCWGFGDNLKEQLQTQYEVETQSGEFFLNQYKDSSFYRALMNAQVALLETLVTLGVGTIAKAFQVSKIGIDLLRTFDILDKASNVYQINELWNDFAAARAAIDKMGDETKSRFSQTLREELERVFKEKFDDEMRRLPENERTVVSLYFKYEDEAKKLNLEVVGIDWKEERRVKAYIRELLRKTDKILTEQEVYKKIFKETPGPSLWEIIAGKPAVDARLVQEGYTAVSKLLFARLCKQARDRIGEAPAGLRLHWKEYETRTIQETQRATAQIDIYTPQLQVALRELQQAR